MAILEAMSSDTPVLLRDLDLYQEILTGYYDEASDNPGFIKKLSELKEDQFAYQSLVRKAQNGAAFYSEERLTKIWSDFYHQLVKE